MLENIIKLLKFRDEEKILKAVKEGTVSIQKERTEIMAYFSLEIIQSR